MGECEKEPLRPKEFYRDKIIKMTKEIEDEWLLGQICRFIQNMTKEGD